MSASQLITSLGFHWVLLKFTHTQKKDPSDSKLEARAWI